MRRLCLSQLEHREGSVTWHVGRGIRKERWKDPKSKRKRPVNR
jgi:hypothetical protein